MALDAYSPDLQSPTDRLHYFHPFRFAIAALVILAADLGLILWLGGGTTSLEARTGLLVALLLIGLARTFQPRTLSANATEIRWKRALQPAQIVPRHEVAAIQYLTTARPGAARYYFVNRDGRAVLWVDRFTPARMGSFASYLGITVRAVSVSPPTSAAAEAEVKAEAIVGSRRSGLIAMGVCAAISLAATVGAAFWVEHEGAVLAAYRRAPLCERPAADPLACRFDAPAVVTAWNNSTGRINIRFLQDVPTFRFRTTWVYIANGAVPHPGFGVGDTVQIEIFDGRALAINGAITDGFNTLQSNASWLLVPATGLFLVVCLIGMAVCWKGPDSWFVNRARPAVSSKPTLDDSPPVTDTPGPNEKPGAIERAPIPGSSADPGDGWPTLVQNPGFDREAFEADPGSIGIPGANERLLARAPVRYHGVPGTGAMLLTDQRLVVLGSTRLEIPRARITLLAYWTVRDSVAVTYRTMSGPRGILLTGPQLVLTGGPNTDMHRLFEAMQTGLTNPDAIREPVVIVRPIGPVRRALRAVGRATNRLWLAWVG